MALDFPNTPTLNQVFTAPNGAMWMWDGAKWTAITSTSAYASSGDVGRNLLHNPLFNVAQRGAGPFTGLGNTLDRWALDNATDTVSVSQRVPSDTERTQIGDEAAVACLQNNFTGNAAAGAYNLVAQRIEGIRRLSGKTVTVSLWAIAGTAGLKLGIGLDQFFGTGGSPSATVSLAGSAVTIPSANLWARYSATFAIPSATGKTLGTNINDWTQLTIWFSSGATNATRSGSVGVQSGTVAIWGVQLEVGSVATPLEKPDPRYDLANCQRFYATLPGVIVAGYSIAGGVSYASFTLPMTMRTTPTVIFGTPQYSNCSGLSTNQVSMQDLQAKIIVTATGTFYALSGTAFSADL